MLIKLTFGLIISSLLAFTSYAQIQNGMEASGVLGQLLDFSATPSFTQGGTNSGPNSYGFGRVNGYAVDTTGHRLFVSDSINQRVLIFNLASDNTIDDYRADFVLGQTDFVTETGTRSQSGMSSPGRLAYDPAGNRLFVIDSTNRRILVFDVTTITNGENAVNVLGQADFTSSSPTASQSVTFAPSGLAFDPLGNRLFAGDSSRVLVFDVTTITNGENAVNVLGKADFTTVDTALAASQSNVKSVNDIAFDTDDNMLYVVDGNLAHRVVVFDTTSIVDGENAVNVLGQSGFTTTTAAVTQDKFSVPIYAAIDSANDRLFVLEENAERIKVFDVSSITDGENAINVIGQNNFTNSTFNSDPQKSISPFAPIGFDASTQSLFTGGGAVKIFDVTSISDGEAAAGLLGSLSSLSPQTISFQAIENNSGVRDIGFDGNYGNALDATGHRLFVVDTGHNRVLVFNLAEDNTFNDYAADFVLGQPSFSVHTSARTQNTLSEPKAAAFDPDNNFLFVADSGNARVLVFDVASITNGENAVKVLGQSNFLAASTTVAQNRLDNPTSVAYDSSGKRLFVADFDHNRVIVYDVAEISDGENAANVLGQSDFTSDTSATTQSGLDEPSAVSYDSGNKRLFVSDAQNNRIMVFDVESITDGENAVAVIGQTDFTSKTDGTTAGKVVFYTSGSNNDMQYDNVKSRLFVSDSGNRRVLVFDGTAIQTGMDASFVLGQSNFTTAEFFTNSSSFNFEGPAAISLDTTNERLYLNDTFSNRVLRFDFQAPTPTPTVTPTVTATPIVPPTNQEIKDGLKAIKSIKGSNKDGVEQIAELEGLLAQLNVAKVDSNYTVSEKKTLAKAAAQLGKFLDTAEKARTETKKSKVKRLREKLADQKSVLKVLLNAAAKLI